MLYGRIYRGLVEPDVLFRLPLGLNQAPSEVAPRNIKVVNGAMVQLVLLFADNVLVGIRGDMSGTIFHINRHWLPKTLPPSQRAHVNKLASLATFILSS